MLLGIALGWVEAAIVLGVIVILFGPSKLPALGQGFGKMLSGFKKEVRALDEVAEPELVDTDSKAPD